MDVFQFSIACKRTNNTNYATHYVKLGKKRRESSKRNYYIISSRVIINAIINFLRADHDMPCIRMCCITSGSKLLVKDLKTYTDEFPLRDPSCLPQCTAISSPDAVSTKVLTLVFVPLKNVHFFKQSHCMPLEFASCPPPTSQEQCWMISTAEKGGPYLLPPKSTPLTMRHQSAILSGAQSSIGA